MIPMRGQASKMLTWRVRWISEAHQWPYEDLDRCGSPAFHAWSRHPTRSTHIGQI